MPTDDLKGLHRVRKRLADGSERLHFYAWRGGPRIESDYGTPDFQREFGLLHQEDTDRRRAGALPRLVRIFDGYQDSSDFSRLAERTRRDYARILDTLRAEFGEIGIRELSVKGTRGEFLDWRDEFGEDNARQADYHWTVLNIAMNWALDRELIERNPFGRAGKLYGTTRVDKIWTSDQERALLAVAPPHIALAFLLALYTGQRQGDLLALEWSAYDGERIALRQRKTGVRVTVKLVSTLKQVLDRTEREHARILVTARGGEPWTENGFRASWGKVKLEAGIAELTFHDLRGTAVTRLFLANCSEAEIATITGHSLKDVRSILDAHYFHRDTRLADSGIAKLQTAITAAAGPVNDNAGETAGEARKPRQFNGYTGAKKRREKAS